MQRIVLLLLCAIAFAAVARDIRSESKLAACIKQQQHLDISKLAGFHCDIFYHGFIPDGGKVSLEMDGMGPVVQGNFSFVFSDDKGKTWQSRVDLEKGTTCSFFSK